MSKHHHAAWYEFQLLPFPVRTTECLIFVLLFFILSPGYGKSFKQDLGLIKQYENPVILHSVDMSDQLIISPRFQSRIMTSSASGMDGVSNGWLDYNVIKSGEGNPGGEDRFSLAPIGSRFSLYYPKGNRFAPELWRVPKALTQGTYPVVTQTRDSANFSTSLEVQNMQGTQFNLLLEREVQLYSDEEIDQLLGITLPPALARIGFSSTNKLTNKGSNWHPRNGLVTIWILGTFQGTQNTLVMIPTESPQHDSRVHTYLNTIHQDRLVQTENLVVLRADGRYRSKIGINKWLTKSTLVSYSPELSRLTLIKFSFRMADNYPISFEENTPDETLGDVTNVYNHDGQSETEAFYELETSAEMKPLKQNESVLHIHQTFHIFGEQAELDGISQAILGRPLSEITTTFITTP